MEKRITLEVLNACYDYDKQRQSVGSRILYFWVEILYTDYLRGIGR